jgi:hypothetical protein
MDPIRWGTIRQRKAGERRLAGEEGNERIERTESFRGTLSRSLYFPDNAASGSARSRVLGHLRTLRTNLEQARYGLMHFKNDRLDRDKLEPAARRVDKLIDMFASNLRDPVQGSLWVSEIQSGIDRVSNPKAAQALGAARVAIAALLAAMAAEGKVP